jgi:hypothetical protein
MSAVGTEKPEACEVANEKERSIELATNVVGFFGGCGRGTDRDIVGVGLLDGDTGELRAVLSKRGTSVRGDFNSWTLIACSLLQIVMVSKEGFVPDMMTGAEAVET